MKRSDAQRVAILVEALGAIDEERTADDLADEDLGQTWDYRGMRLGIASMSLGSGGDFGGVDIASWVDIDIATRAPARPAASQADRGRARQARRRAMMRAPKRRADGAAVVAGHDGAAAAAILAAIDGGLLR